MLQLVYISTAKQQISDDGLRDILASSRQRNGLAGVTGLLVAGGKRFLQVLEGPDAAVAATFKRLKDDPRHHACVVLSSRPILERGFGSWAMAYCRGLDEEAGDLLGVVSALTSTLHDQNLRAEFVGFANLHSSRHSARAA